MRTYRHTIYALTLAALVALAAIGCSTQQNTAKSRWWHSFNARYNTYYNGTLAYIDGALAKEEGNKDNFTEPIPLYTVGNKASRDLGKGNFDRAVEKCQKAIKLHSIKRRPVWDKKRRKTERDIEWLQRKEYNPFLWKAWMLMGRSQFYKGDFDEAASTFSYMSRLYRTQPAIYGRARAWLAKCYIEEGWLYDAEDVIRNMRRDSIHWRAQKEWDYTYADYYIHTADYEQAISYLRRVIKHEMRRKQRAREWYLMGQMEASLGHKALASKAFRKVIRQYPPYELEFNARIALTEVLSTDGQARKMIGRLKRMAASDKNKEYLDQVYYAIGNIHLTQKDTLKAIDAYEQGNKKATRSGIEKGVLLLKLGDLYWAMERYNDAQRCYGEAIGLLDKERPDYEQLSDRSKKLDELVPYTDAVHLQDSLQALAKADEKTRNAAIDKVIEALKKKEKEERRKQAEQEANEMVAKNSANNGSAVNNRRQQTNNTQQEQKGAWYFYNPMAVSQGKTEFQRRWGKRENTDNWQRSNKTVVSLGALGQQDEEGVPTDSLGTDSTSTSSDNADEQKTDSAQNDPHRREYYLAQIPLTEEQMAASNLIIEDGLYHAGVIFKDKFDNLPLGEKALRRLEQQYPDFEKMADVYYHLFLLYSRQHNDATAQQYLNRLKEKYPDNEWTTLLTDPYYKENAVMGTHMEDSLYAATYDAFKAERYTTVMSNVGLSAKRFPLGANRDKFLFIGALGKLNEGQAEACVTDLKTMLEKYPQSALAEMAGMIVRGVGEGRRLHGGRFDIGNIWERRSVVLNDSDKTTAPQLSDERNANFVFMLAYQPDSVDENRLLFELARYNFTSYMVRNFDIAIEDDGALHRMQVSGFRNYDEALQYARQLYAQTRVMRLAAKGRGIIISEPNLQLLGRQYSYDDYDRFYDKHFAPLKVSNMPLLDEPDIITTDDDQGTQRQPRQEEAQPDNGTVIPDIDTPDTSTNQGATVVPDEPAGNVAKENGTTIVPEEPNGTTIAPEEPNGATIAPEEPNGTTIVPEEPNGTTIVPDEPNGATIVPEEPQKAPTPVRRQENIVVPEDKPSAGERPRQSQNAQSAQSYQSPQSNQAPQRSQPQAKPKVSLEEEFYFDEGTTTKPSTKKKEEKAELEDEYYDLDGF